MAFNYLPEGILVEGRWYPLLKMEWIEGVHLTRWLESHHQNQRAITDLAKMFVALIEDLDDAGISHGDLQHGNLLVAPDNTLRLVDYDGLYVPALAGLQSIETGHRNYQSPLRSADDFGPTVDRFSAWVIYTSLMSLAADPTLWTQLHDPHSEYLILAEDDFVDPASSAHFPALLHHADPAVRSLAGRLRDLTKKSLDELPDLISTINPVVQQVALPDTPEEASTKVEPGRPKWLESHLSNDIVKQSYTYPSGGPAFRGRRVRETALGWLGLLSFLIPSILWGLGILGFSLSVAAAAVGGSLFLGFSVRSRSIRSEVQGLHNEQQSLKQLLALAREASTKYAELSQERALRAAEEKKRANDISDQHRELTRRLHQAYARIESERIAEADRLAQEVLDLAIEQNKSVSEILRPLQQPWVDRQLPLYPITKARLSALTKSDVARLASVGIHTAADFTTVEIVKSGSAALLVLPDGRTLKVTGVGPQKARILMGWRRSCEAAATKSCPVSLRPEQLAEIKDLFDPLKRDIEARKQRLELDVESKREDARRKLAVERERLTEHHQSALDTSHARRLDHEREQAELRTLAGELHHLQQSQERLLRYARNLSTSRYLRFLYFGK
ncbi:AarF/UbiB family protein [Streptomyces sp. NPDC059443]|uniref:AarF/UbiB family protein n=1 Tax=unclassified Streptomyces TaxID=2593676 RepID=UPI0036CC89C9